MNIVLNVAKKNSIGLEIIMSRLYINQAIQVIPLLNGTEWIISIKALDTNEYDVGIDLSNAPCREIEPNEVNEPIDLENLWTGLST